MDIMKWLRDLSPDKLLNWMNHLDFIGRFVSNAFSSGQSKAPSGGVHEAHKEMVDEAITITTHTQLHEELLREGYAEAEIDAIFLNMGRFFYDRRWFVDAFRESMSVIADVQTRINNLKKFALASDEERIYLCQQIDQRSGWARWFHERFVEAGQVWDRVLRRDLTFAKAEQLYLFLKQLPWIERRQFALSIGSLKSEIDRTSCLEELFAAYPDMDRMAVIAEIRGLIKPSILSLVIDGYRTLEKYYGNLDTPEGNARAAALRAERVANMKLAYQTLSSRRGLRWLAQ